GNRVHYLQSQAPPLNGVALSDMGPPRRFRGILTPEVLAQRSLDRTRGRRVRGLVKIGLLPINTQLQASTTPMIPRTRPIGSSASRCRSSPQARLCHMKPSRSINIAVLIVLTATLLAGCASVPPVAITDMRQIEGKWQ